MALSREKESLPKGTEPETSADEDERQAINEAIRLDFLQREARIARNKLEEFVNNLNLGERNSKRIIYGPSEAEREASELRRKLNEEIGAFVTARERHKQ